MTTAQPCGVVSEIGYIFGRASWGRGIATEAACACLWYGFERLVYEEIGAGEKRQNGASLRMLEKLGMRRAPNKPQYRSYAPYHYVWRAYLALCILLAVRRPRRGAPQAHARSRRPYPRLGDVQHSGQ